MRVREAWAIFLRGLLVQASWSFERMQGPGLFLMTWPVLRRRHAGDAAALARAAARNLRYFNTHPYFAGLVAATVLREEEAGTPAQADDLARTLMSALGAVGDTFFWAHLRPLAGLVALPLALAGLWWAPLVLLAVFNVPHLGVRVWGVVAGMVRGRGILATLQRLPLTRAVPGLGVALAAATGLLAGFLAGRPDWALVPGSPAGSVAAAGALFALLVALFSRGLPLQRLLAGGVAAAAVAGVFTVVTGP